MWAHMLYSSNPGFCRLRDLVKSKDFSEFWDNEELVASIQFVKDYPDGEVITEEEACALNDKYEPLPKDSCPDTSSGNKRRRTF